MICINDSDFFGKSTSKRFFWGLIMKNLSNVLSMPKSVIASGQRVKDLILLADLGMIDCVPTFEPVDDDYWLFDVEDEEGD